jgi:hypothetical protein
VITWNQIVPMGEHAKAFFVQMCTRIAALSEAQGI